jgi:Flp pilus assembly pilin Flp
MKGKNMERMRRILAGFFKDERGTETLEWGLVCGLLVVGAITAITLIGPKVTDMWSDLNNEIPDKD